MTTIVIGTAIATITTRMLIKRAFVRVNGMQRTIGALRATVADGATVTTSALTLPVIRAVTTKREITAAIMETGNTVVTADMETADMGIMAHTETADTAILECSQPASMVIRTA